MRMFKVEIAVLEWLMRFKPFFNVCAGSCTGAFVLYRIGSGKNTKVVFLAFIDCCS